LGILVGVLVAVGVVGDLLPPAWNGLESMPWGKKKNRRKRNAGIGRTKANSIEVQITISKGNSEPVSAFPLMHDMHHYVVPANSFEEK
jgi:hypothetical protein